MSKEYLMFVDERGCYSDSDESKFSMVGIILEYNYCTDSFVRESELTDKLEIFKKNVISVENLKGIRLNDIIYKENVFSSDTPGRIISDISLFLKNLRFSVISTSIKQDRTKSKDLYELAVNNLIRHFYSFLITKKAKCGGIVVESRHDGKNNMMPQKFFDVYNERTAKFYIYKDIDKKINKFMVCEIYNKQYKSAIELLNTINSILLKILCLDDEHIWNMEYKDLNKILSVIREKTYKEEIDLINDNTQRYINVNLDKYAKESEKLKNQLLIKNRKIKERDQEIGRLTEEINILKQQLNSSITNRKSDSIVFDILSEVDVKIKGIEKQALINANS
ncbi:MAG: hypothetical protein E7208_04290 [Clostridium butyricum]|nr:hypothetical protein [Clostridium butyricum]